MVEPSLPKPSTTGFKFPNSMFNYPLKGQWDPHCAQLTSMMLSQPLPPTNQRDIPIAQFRKMVEQAVQMINSDTTNKQYKDVCHVKEVTIDASRYAQDGFEKRRLRILIHTPNTLNLPQLPNQQRNKIALTPALVYFHGGGGVALSPSDTINQMNRYAYDNGLIVFNVDYRLAPEHKAPAGIMDA